MGPFGPPGPTGYRGINASIAPAGNAGPTTYLATGNANWIATYLDIGTFQATSTGGYPGPLSYSWAAIPPFGSPALAFLNPVNASSQIVREYQGDLYQNVRVTVTDIQGNSAIHDIAVGWNPSITFVSGSTRAVAFNSESSSTAVYYLTTSGLWYLRAINPRGYSDQIGPWISPQKNMTSYQAYVSGGNTEDSSPIAQWVQLGFVDQQWRVVRTGDSGSTTANLSVWIRLNNDANSANWWGPISISLTAAKNSSGT